MGRGLFHSNTLLLNCSLMLQVIFDQASVRLQMEFCPHDPFYSDIRDSAEQVVCSSTKGRTRFYVGFGECFHILKTVQTDQVCSLSHTSYFILLYSSTEFVHVSARNSKLGLSCKTGKDTTRTRQGPPVTVILTRGTWRARWVLESTGMDFGI